MYLLENEDTQKVAELTSSTLCELCISGITILHDETKSLCHYKRFFQKDSERTLKILKEAGVLEILEN